MKKHGQWYILEAHVEYPKELHKKHNKLPYLGERIKIGKVKNLVPNFRDKNTCVVHIKNLNEALKHGLKLGH